MHVLNFTDLEASFVILYNGKISKNAPKHEIVDFEPFSIQLFFINFYKRPIDQCKQEEKKCTTKLW